MKQHINRISRLFLHNLKYGIIIFTLASTLTGCSNQLIPRDLKDYVSANLKIERRRVDLTQPFRTRITLRVNKISILEARQAGKDLIKCCVEYFQRDNVTDFINDTLVFSIRLDVDADTRISWWTVADDMKMLVNNKMSFEEFVERCRKVEEWSPDL